VLTRVSSSAGEPSRGGDQTRPNDEKRATVDVDGAPASFLTAGDGPVVVLLHGTYRSRVWLPILDDLAAAGVRPIAVDLPGSGRSGGELTLQAATIPELSAWVARFVRALGVDGPVSIVGHDIGGAIAQHLLVSDTGDVKHAVGKPNKG
jgi:pimeloyl-ACP methyl ester carboxylesterase